MSVVVVVCIVPKYSYKIQKNTRGILGNKDTRTTNGSVFHGYGSDGIHSFIDRNQKIKAYKKDIIDTINEYENVPIVKDFINDMYICTTIDSLIITLEKLCDVSEYVVYIDEIQRIIDYLLDTLQKKTTDKLMTHSQVINKL